MSIKPFLPLGISLLILTGCGGNGENTAKTNPAEQAQTAVEKTAETATNTTEAAKTAIDKTAETAKTATEDAAKTATEGAQSAMETAQGTMDKATDAAKTATEGAQSAMETAQGTMGKATDAAKGMVKDVTALKEGATGITTGISNTLTAVKSGDMTKAQDEFSTVQESWAGIEDSVKEKSAKGYEEVEGHLKTLTTLFENSKPDAAKITSELQALSKSFTTATTGK